MFRLLRFLFFIGLLITGRLVDPQTLQRMADDIRRARSSGGPVAAHVALTGPATPVPSTAAPPPPAIRFLSVPDPAGGETAPHRSVGASITFRKVARPAGAAD